MIGSTSTTLAADGGMGYSSSRAERSATFVGVLPASARELRIVDESGRVVIVPLNADDAYWITVSDPVDIVLTKADGTEHHVPFARLGT
jgi:hypothetical protein